MLSEQSSLRPQGKACISPELLMPAGDPEKLRYAFAYGADAVYAGVPVFSLRARENGFRRENLKDAIEYTHALGKKIYVTMNIYVHNSRVQPFLDSFCEVADLQPDGFIMSDVGLISKARKLRPTAAIHLSTQANATNWATVEFWQSLGVERIVLPRELSIKEIAEIHHRVPDIELEAFVHGSICIAYSGRCLISNYLSHRDANEGTCTNSCRWEYSLGVKSNSLKLSDERNAPSNRAYEALSNEYYVVEQNRLEQRFELDEDEHGTYMMNSKDLCAIELLQELREAGVVSFKVEGRSKGLYYVAAIARAYRRAIDDTVDGRHFNTENLREVVSTSNRTLTTGFMIRRPEEYGQNYDDGSSQALTHRYGGQVLEIDRTHDRALVLLKNPIRVGDSLEWISPESSFEESVEEMFAENGEPIDRAHGGMKAWLPCVRELSEWTLLRLPIRESDYKPCPATAAPI